MSKSLFDPAKPESKSEIRSKKEEHFSAPIYPYINSYSTVDKKTFFVWSPSFQAIGHDVHYDCDQLTEVLRHVLRQKAKVSLYPDLRMLLAIHGEMCCF